MNVLPEHDRQVNFWPVYSDVAMVMILMLVLFILTQFVMNSRLLLNQTFAVAENERLYLAKQKVAKGQERIRQLFSDEPGVTSIREDGNLQIFTFSADVLFSTDEASLSPQGEDLLRRFGKALKDHVEFYKRIEIEGHADEHPSQKFFRRGDVETDHGNWRLSAERAITVTQLFQQLEVKGEQLAVVGRSFYEPASPDRSPNQRTPEQARAQNRRVTVRLFYSEVTS